jgi:primosomal protein N' (replication factor Y) (superfamily II helicase)
MHNAAMWLAFLAGFSHCAFMQIVAVLIPMGLTGPYDYIVPAGLELAPGDIVRVPLGRREVDGVVWGEARGDVAKEKLKAVLTRYPVAPLAKDLMLFVDWVAQYVMAPAGSVLRQIMRVPAAFEPAAPLTAWRESDHETNSRPTRMTPARERVFKALKDGAILPTADLIHAAEVSASVIKGLAEAGFVQQVPIAAPSQFQLPRHDLPGFELSPDQAKIAQVFRETVAAKAFSVHLLDGVTGSGKTEVYFDSIAEALAQGRQALVLLPEISLTSQFLDRFKKRFGCLPAVWHSGLGASDRRNTWRAVSNGEVRVLVGARSALFLPWSDLGTIIVDEEHDSGFKQEEGVIYNARDMAVVRARLASCPVILASATPSIESIVNAQKGRYVHHRLLARHGAAKMPELKLIDMRVTPPEKGRWMVPQMVEAIKATIEQGQQSLVFLNRRGYAPLTICRSCGHRYACGQCDAWMVEHRFRKQLACHHCGLVEPVPHECEECGAEGSLTACGPGVERITEEVVNLFPDARTAILSSDHAGGNQALRQTLEQIIEGDVDIIIGTQIVAKGHHFPKLSFVGVVDADLGLGNGDLRAAEKTYQLLSQVAGRAGRDRTLGHAILQSYMPDHPVLQALVAGDRDGFIERECMAREMAHMPPFGRLAAIIVSSPSPQEGLNFVRQMATKIPHHPDINVLGPAPAPIARLRNRYRYRFLIKASRDAPVQSFIRQWLAPLQLRGGLRLSVDIDPYSFM